MPLNVSPPLGNFSPNPEYFSKHAALIKRSVAISAVIFSLSISYLNLLKEYNVD